MEVKAPTKADISIIWPEHLGVEGLSTRAAGTFADEGSAHRALAALGDWLPGLDHGVDECAAGLVEVMRPERFPFTEVLAHYRAVGRTHVAGELTVRLRHINDLLRSPALAPTRRMWPLPQWLPSTVDQRAGTYDSYLVASLLESITDVDDPGGHGADDRTDAEVEYATDRTIDMLLAALAADMALTEAEALRSGHLSRQQRRRTQACLLVLSRIADLAPRWAKRPRRSAELDPATGHLSDEARLAEATSELATQIHRWVPHPCRFAVELAMLPTTRLHDEQMFIRSIQIFETIYRQVYRCLVRTSTAIVRREADRACAELADATRRLNLSSVLYRVVTTMPRDTFAIIREYTDGRSAIQSRSYRQIERICAPRPPGPVAGKLPVVEVASPTLQDAFLAIAGQFGPAGADRLAGQLRALDESWRAMKRTHWGITLKIIGRVSGTGGTTGADYLKQARTFRCSRC